MKIVHVSYSRNSKFRSSEAWLSRIDFFVPILEEMAKSAYVFSFYAIGFEGELLRNGVKYSFVGSSFFSWRKMNKEVISLDPDVVVVHGLGFPIQTLLLLRRLPSHATVVVVHHAEQPSLFWKTELQKRVGRFVDAYFFAHKDLAEKWIKKKVISDQTQVHEMMEVTSAFNYESGFESLRNPYQYLWVGNMDSNKDPITLLNAFIMFSKSSPQSFIRIIFRDGELADRVKQMIKTAGISSNQISMLENVKHSLMKEHFARSTFIISTSHYEGSGTAVCEAISCGCIPILSNIASFNMMSGGGNIGLSFTPGNADELLSALFKSTQINVAEERAKVLAQYNRSLSAKAIASKSIAVFTKLLKTGS